MKNKLISKINKQTNPQFRNYGAKIKLLVIFQAAAELEALQKIHKTLEHLHTLLRMIHRDLIKIKDNYKPV